MTKLKAETKPMVWEYANRRWWCRLDDNLYYRISKGSDKKFHLWNHCYKLKITDTLDEAKEYAALMETDAWIT